MAWAAGQAQGKGSFGQSLISLRSCNEWVAHRAPKVTFFFVFNHLLPPLFHHHRWLAGEVKKDPSSFSSVPFWPSSPSPACPKRRTGLVLRRRQLFSPSTARGPALICLRHACCSRQQWSAPISPEMMPPAVTEDQPGHGESHSKVSVLTWMISESKVSKLDRGAKRHKPCDVNDARWGSGGRMCGEGRGDKLGREKLLDL